MPRAHLIRLTVSTLALATVWAGGTAARAPLPAQVEKLLMKQDAGATAAAEAMAAAAPGVAANRALLGRAYLAEGRFASAEAAFSDAISLDPNDGASALKLALVQIAQGKTAVARAVLENNRDHLGGADYGLAIALSGDAEGGVRILEAVTRAPGVDAKARQNLALAYALTGKWLNARVMAVQDLPPAEADARIISWMNFVRPTAAHDQVAALLGVTPAVSDAGQPVALALVKLAAPVAVAVVESRPEPIAVAEVAPVGPTIETVAAAVAAAPKIVFAALREVVQPLPMAKPMLVRTLAAPKPYVAPTTQVAGGGRYVVQLGAYASNAVAQSAWQRGAARLGLKDYTPSSGTARVRNVGYVRLSIAGFADRDSAVRLCGRVRSAGGKCFVRGVSGDRIASWVRAGMPERVAVR